MIRRWLPRVPIPLAFLLLFAAPSAGQDLDLTQLFSNEPFYKVHGILSARGEVPFVGHVWFLPGAADTTRGLLGVGLANTAFRWARDDEGHWHTTYRVTAELEPGGGGPKIERQWEKTVDVDTFDETLLTGESIVFQAELPLAPGKYDARITVTDLVGDQQSRAEGSIEAPAFRAPAVGEPVLLRRLDRVGDSIAYVVHPSHTFPAPPERVEFMLQARGEGGPLVARARLIEPEAGGEPMGTWSDTLRADADGAMVAFGAIDNTAQFGEYRVEVDLLDAAGAVVSQASTPYVIAGSAAWIADHWKEALSLIRYAATENEMDILEDIDDRAGRIDAWACFWRMRDPISTTLVNEAMLEYFNRIQTANETWRSSLRPGYLSDRGRVYVTIGPPDDIESNPMPFGQLPYEVWTYQRGRQFQLLFVDRIGFNNYQLDNMAAYQRELSIVDGQKRALLATRKPLCPLLAPAFE